MRVHSAWLLNGGAARARGRIEQRGNVIRVVVYAGIDPATGKRAYLREKLAGTDSKALKRAETTLDKLLAQVGGQWSAPSGVSLAEAMNEWFGSSEIEDSTSGLAAALVSNDTAEDHRSSWGAHATAVGPGAGDSGLEQAAGERAAENVRSDLGGRERGSEIPVSWKCAARGTGAAARTASTRSATRPGTVVPIVSARQSWSAPSSTARRASSTGHYYHPDEPATISNGAIEVRAALLIEGIRHIHPNDG